MNTIAVTRRSWFGGPYTSAIRQGLRDHRLLYALSFFCLFAAYAEASLLGVPPKLKPVYFLTIPIFMAVGVLILIGLMLELWRLNRRKYEGAILPALWEKIHTRDFAPQRVSNAVHSTICMTAFMTGFTAIKDLIPVANPFSWDIAFTELDRVLHFGSQPYEWLAPILNVPFITYVINLNYNLWFFVMLAFCFWHGFAHTENRLRQHFFFAFMLTWFLGTSVFGTVFSSVGPGLYGRFYADQIDPFKPLMAWLQHTSQFYPVYSMSTMDQLWESYVQGKGLISGISAMPSMHVGSSVLFVICALVTGKRWLIWATSVFCAAIFIGSIHLAWHYAADGYLGAAIAVFCWWISGKIVNQDRAARGVA